MIYGKILGIETSCDETGASVVESDGQTLKILSNVLASSVKLHSKTGGIIPETAAREQLRFIIPVIKEALTNAKITNPSKQISAIALTFGPGLIGSLLVGVETAKALSYIWKVPTVPINHLYGHIYANFIEQKGAIEFPAVGLVVSGGHTDLVFMKDNMSLKWIGGTRDDAAGECLDKVGRLLDLSYPAGPSIEKLANKGDSKRFLFPSPLISSSDFDFSLPINCFNFFKAKITARYSASLLVPRPKRRRTRSSRPPRGPIPPSPPRRRPGSPGRPVRRTACCPRASSPPPRAVRPGTPRRPLPRPGP